MEEQKWTKWDKWLISIQIISIIVSIIIAFVPEDKLTATIKLTIICACIGIPILIVQITITVGQNRIESNILTLISTLKDATNQTTQIATLFQICTSQNERIRRFADRRISEMTKSLELACRIGSSGELNVTDYYMELNYLADKLEKDDKNKCLIWAMTGFAPDEWSAAGGYESAWTQRLQHLSESGVKTTRICLLSEDIVNAINADSFIIEQHEGHHLPIEGLISLLKQYYTKPDQNCKHYIILNNEFELLERIKGFFGIILSNQEKYIIEGEALNLDKGLTGNVLFNTQEIEAIYNEFRFACQQNREIISYLRRHSSPAFLAYLQEERIIIN